MKPIMDGSGLYILWIYAHANNKKFFNLVLSFAAVDELPKTAWLVSKMGRLTAGVQYEPTCMILLALIPVSFLS